MHTTNLKKYSFTLIELVISIVVVGIVITAIPALLTTTSNVNKTNLEEKTFFSAFALLNLVQTTEWDENNTIGDNYYKVLKANGGDSELLCQRTGVIQLDNYSGATCADGNTTSHIGIDSGEDENNVSTFDDMDDFNGYSTIISYGPDIDDINLSISVRYMNDSTDYSRKNIYFTESDAPASGTNLKFLELNVTQNNKLISVLKYTASNIGMTKIESRNE